MSNGILARNALFKAVSKSEFDGLPRSAKRKLWNAACKTVGFKVVYTDKRKSAPKPKPKVQPKRRSKQSLVRWANQVAAEVREKEQHEAEQRHFDRFPHAYTGSRW